MITPYLLRRPPPPPPGLSIVLKGVGSDDVLLCTIKKNKQSNQKAYLSAIYLQYTFPVPFAKLHRLHLRMNVGPLMYTTYTQKANHLPCSAQGSSVGIQSWSSPTIETDRLIFESCKEMQYNNNYHVY